ENLPIKHVISGNSSAFTPTPLDIGTFVSVAHKLGMAIHATVRRKNSRTLVGRPWISLRRNGTGVWVFIRLQAGERDVRISHQAQPRGPEQGEYTEKQLGKLVHATVTSGVLSAEVSGTCERHRTRPGSKNISATATANVKLATKMMRAASD